MPNTAEPWTSVREKLIKMGAKVVNYGRYVTFRMAKVAVPPHTFQGGLSLAAQLPRIWGMSDEGKGGCCEHK